MKNNKIIKIAIVFASCLTLGTLISGVFLCNICLSDEKDMERVNILMENGGYLQAIKVLESLIMKANDQEAKAKYHYLTATCYRKLGQWGKAVTHYQLAAEKTDSEFAPIARLRMAKGYQSIGDRESAIKEYDLLLRHHPDSVSAMEAYYQLGENYFALKHYETALDHYKKFVENYPKSTRLRLVKYKIGYMYQSLKQWAEAYNQYQDLICQNAEDYIAQTSLDKLNAVLSSCPSIIVTREDRIHHGFVLYYAQKYDEARTQFKKVIKGSDSLSAQADFFIAESYYQEKEYVKAQVEYESVVKHYPQESYAITSQYQIAMCQLRLDRKYSGNTLLAKFIVAYPDNHLADDAGFQIGDSYKDEEQYNKSAEAYMKVADEYPASDLADNALWNAGWCYLNLKDYEKSATTFQRLIDKYPKSDRAGEARFWAGISYEKAGKWREASNAYKESVQNRDWYYSGRSMKRMQALANSGKVDKSIIQQDKPNSDSSSIIDEIEKNTSPWFHDLLESRVFDDIIDQLTLYEEAGNDQKTVYYNLSICYEKMGEFRSSWVYARRVYDMVSAKNGNNDIPVELRRRAYPLVYKDAVLKYAREHSIDPLLVLAVMLEESKHDHNAVSRSGALGLMQIMPTTGKDIANRLNIAGFDKDMLLNPETNIRMGTWYLKWLTDMFNDRVHEYFNEKKMPKSEPEYSDIITMIILGAYNGGPTRAGNWIERYGIDDMDEFVENIPIPEPKRYIKKVIDSYESYKSLYSL